MAHVHQDPLGHLHVPQLHTQAHHVLHAPAGDPHLPPVPGGQVDDLPDPVHVGGKGGNDDPLITVLEQLVKPLKHPGLGIRIPGPFHVGGIHEQGQYPLPAQFAEPGQIRHFSLQRRHIDLEIPGLDHQFPPG